MDKDTALAAPKKRTQHAPGLAKSWELANADGRFRRAPFLYQPPSGGLIHPHSPYRRMILIGKFCG